jgi:hypothetical protein
LCVPYSAALQLSSDLGELLYFFVYNVRAARDTPRQTHLPDTTQQDKTSIPREWRAKS